MNELLIDLTPLLEAVLGLLFLLLMRYAIPWVKTKLTNEQIVKAKTFVEIGVYAMEKAFGAGHGKEKLKGVEALLAEKGIKLETDVLLQMVNAEIKKMELLEAGGGRKLAE